MAWFDLVGVREVDLYRPEPDTFAALGKPDILIHLAWGGLHDFNAHSHFETELPVQYAFLKAAVLSGLPRLLVTGTCLEYGLQSGRLAETLPSDPVTPYGMAKDALRRQLEFLQSKSRFSLAWARLFYMWGDCPGRRTLFMQLKEAAERGDAAFPMSAGEQLRDYLTVEGVAERLIALATTAANPGVVNVCSGAPVAVRTLVEGWLSVNDWTMRLERGRYPYPAYEPLAFWGDARKFNHVVEG
jgi:dTDP-6-deoxy-L-talose 4-dehydrogenase (NAD+)